MDTTCSTANLEAYCAGTEAFSWEKHRNAQSERGKESLSFR